MFMTNMTEASATEKKGLAIYSIQIFGMPLPLTALIAITVLISITLYRLTWSVVSSYVCYGAILVKSANVYQMSSNILAAHRL